MFYQNSWNVACDSKQFILGNFSTFESTSLPVAGSFIATTWIWNVAVYTGNPKVTTQLTPWVAICGFLTEKVLFVNTELFMYSVFTIEYSRELFVETKWHGAVSVLITMLNGTFVLPQISADSG
jgi:hypothetical protein